MAAKKEKIAFYGTGRRKKSIARVRLVNGNGNITINNKTKPPIYSAIVVARAAPFTPISGNPQFPKIKAQSRKTFKLERIIPDITRGCVYPEVASNTFIEEPKPVIKKIGAYKTV